MRCWESRARNWHGHRLVLLQGRENLASLGTAKTLNCWNNINSQMFKVAAKSQANLSPSTVPSPASRSDEAKLLIPPHWGSPALSLEPTGNSVLCYKSTMGGSQEGSELPAWVSGPSLGPIQLVTV